MRTINGCVLPEDLYYWKDHSWVRTNKEEEKVKIGLDDFAQRNAGEIIYISIRPKGEFIPQGETFAMLEAYKWVGAVKSPLSGMIVEINHKLEQDPRLINKDPYGDGWVIEIKPSNLKEELKNLYYESTAVDWIKEEIEKIKKAKKVKK